jgi:nucleotide-binding universal stress UspA family protein
MKFQTILCPIDFSKYSEKIIEMATSLTFSNTIHLFHCLEINTITDPQGFPMQLSNDMELLKSDHKEYNTFKEKITSLYPQFNFTFEFERTHSVSESIIDYSKKVKADAIVMGSHGRSGLERFLMGSVAESVMRESHKSVILCKFA